MASLPEYKEQTGSCSACGNSAVPHRITFVMATVQVWHAVLARRAGRIALLRALERAVQHFLYALDRLNYRLWQRLGLLGYGHDPVKARSYRSQVIWEEAQQRKIPMEQAIFLGRATDVYRAYIKGTWFHFESLPVPPQLEQEAASWIDDKYLLNRHLAAAGIPMPFLASVVTRSAARRAFAASGGRAVVKPRSGSRGRHTTTHVGNVEDLDKAFASARMLGMHVCVGTHLRGGVCRGTVVDGQLVGFFQAFPPRVTGDGISTITALVAAKNDTKPERVQDIVLSGEHAAFLARLGYAFDSVLPAGATVDLTHRTGRLFGGETRELVDSVHPQLRAYLEHAARVLHVPVVGFDLIIENPEHDPDTQEWGIIEANSLPFIDLHYLPLHGTPSNVAAYVWDLWEKKTPLLRGFPNHV